MPATAGLGNPIIMGITKQSQYTNGIFQGV
jgi:hypothetical protein